jgi:CelD/BcsL family acetyltransferase involved in cellulose biosynthesis
LSARWAEGPEACAALESAWPTGDAGGISPFQSVAWLRHWFRHRAGGALPVVMVLPEESTAVAFVIRRFAGLRVLQLAGAPDSDYTDPVGGGSPAPPWPAIAAGLEPRRTRFDAVHLPSIRTPEAAAQALRTHLGASLAWRPYDVCPFIDTSTAWDGLLARRGRALEREIRRWRRRIEERGTSAIEVWEPPIPNPVLEQLADVERASWKWRHGNAMLRDESQRGFLEAILQDAASPARLWLLRIAGRAVAFALVLVDAHAWYYYWPSHREEVANGGSLLLAEIVRAACEGPCCCLDLLRGAYPYKLLWADGSREVHELVSSGAGAGQLVVWAHRLRWRAARSARLRALRERLLRVGDRRPEAFEASPDR